MAGAVPWAQRVIAHHRPEKGTTMNAARHLGRGALGTVATTTLLLAGTSAAWAGPAPVERGPAGGGAASPSSAVDGTSGWEIVTVGAASAALAVLLTLLAMYVVLHHRATRDPRPA
jgi:hypothetical protein